GLLAFGSWSLGQTPQPPVGPVVPPFAAAPQDAPLPSLIKSFVAPGEAKPILLSADAIATWLDAGQRIVLLRGHVNVEQGLTALGFSEGTVWIDENGKKTNGIYNVRVYAEGPLTVGTGPTKQTANKGWIDLATRGEIRVKAYGSKVIQQALPNEPLYQK